MALSEVQLQETERWPAISSGQAALQNLGLNIREDGRVKVWEDRIIEIGVPANGGEKARWAHKWRAILRTAVFRLVEGRREAYAGISRGVDRTLTAVWFNHAQTELSLRFGLTMRIIPNVHPCSDGPRGAEITASYRSKRGRQEDSRCRWCGEEEVSSTDSGTATDGGRPGLTGKCTWVRTQYLDSWALWTHSIGR